MRHLARRHDITYLSFMDPSQTPADLEGMREVASHLVTIPRTDPPKGTLRFYADAAGYLLDRVPYAVAKYRSADVPVARIERLPSGTPVRCRRLRFSSTRREPAGLAALPGDSLHPQRGSGNLAAPRRERRPTRSRGSCSASSGAGCARSNDGALAPLRSRAGRLRRGPPHVRPTLSRRA